MRQFFAFFLSILLLVPVASAQPKHDWSNVEKLKRDAPLIVQLRTGEKVRGTVVDVSDDLLRLAAFVPHDFGATYLREINRADVRRIELVLRDQHLPDPQKWAIAGAVVGGASGVGLGIYRDHTEPTACGHACWFLDGVAGAGGGYMAGLVSAGFVGLGHLFLHNRLIYEDRDISSPQTPQR